MTVKIPTNLEGDPNFSDAAIFERCEITHTVVNQSNKDLLVKYNAWNLALEGKPIGDQDLNNILINIGGGMDLVRAEFLEPETPLDAYIIDRLKSKIDENFTNGIHILEPNRTAIEIKVRINKANLPEYVGADGGVHSRLLGMSLYGFGEWEEEDLHTPAPFTNKEVCDEHGNKISTNPKSQIVYEYVNNTDPELVLYAPVGKEVIKLVPMQDPSTQNEIRISIKSGGGKVRKITQSLPEFSGNQEAFFKTLETLGYYLQHSDAAKAISSKSLQHAESMVKELTKEVETLNTKLVKLEDSKGKLKEANSKQQLKQEQSSIWNKLFESVIKVPFSIIASLLERKLTALVATRLLAALI